MLYRLTIQEYINYEIIINKPLYGYETLKAKLKNK